MLDCVKHWCSIIPPMQVAATFVTNHCSLTDPCATRVWFKVNSTKDEEDMCHKCSHLLINTKAKGQFYHVEYYQKSLLHQHFSTANEISCAFALYWMNISRTGGSFILLKNLF